MNRKFSNSFNDIKAGFWESLLNLSAQSRQLRSKEFYCILHCFLQEEERIGQLGKISLILKEQLSVIRLSHPILFKINKIV